MPIIRRDDGVQFALQPYRELLNLKNTSLLKKEIHLLATSHGTYARIFKQEDGRYEAVFSPDPCFLLGEMVWQHFGKPANLLYCEALSDKQSALIVVVRDGSVYLDAEIPYANLAEELASVLAGKTAFAIYVYGDVPLSQQAEEGKLTLAPDAIKSFTRLNEAVTKNLVPDNNLRFLPVDRAVAELKLDQRASMLTFGILGVLVIAIFWWFTTQSNTQTQQNVDPYQAYENALQTPAPVDQLNEIAKQLLLVYSIPGWVPTRLTYNNAGAQIELHSFGSSLTDLLQWANAHGLTIAIANSGALLTLPANHAGRVPPALQNAQQILAKVIDRMMLVVPNKSVQIATAISHGIYQETPVGITLDNVSPDVLKLVGQALAGLPINLSSCAFDLKNGLVSGTIQLTVLGN